MSTLVVPQVASGLSNEELADLVAKLSKELDWFSRNIDSKNVRNIAGYNVSEYDIKHISGIVGMSGYDAANPNAVRFWSGSADKANAPFRVTQDGVMTAVGGLFQSAAGYPRVEINSANNLIAAYNTASKYVAVTPSQGGTPGISWNDGSNVAYAIAEASVGLIMASFSGGLSFQSSNYINLNPTGSLLINGDTGWTGAISVITSVDFANQKTTFGIINVKKGIIINYA